jgi:subtilisin family serine protease
VLHVLSFIVALGVQLDPGNIDALVRTLLSTPGVLAVRYDPLGSLTLVDPISSVTPPSTEGFHWGLARILVPEVQQYDGLQGSGVAVAFVDTGIDSSHSEFRNARGSTRIGGGFNAVADEGGGCKAGSNGGAYNDYHGHGTHVAGIASAAVNGQAIIGAAPQLTIMAVKVLDQNAHGFLSDFLCGLEWVYNRNIPLVNMSVGFWNNKVLLEKAIQRLFQKRVIMVAAAGNRITGSDPSCVAGVEGGGIDDGGGEGQSDESVSCDPSSDDPMYPAEYQSWVIPVAATNRGDQLAYYSRYEPGIMAAPGGEQPKPENRILSTRRGGGYAVGSGTSQAAAHVTGAMALALNKTPNLTFDEARNTLQATAWDLVNYSGSQQNLKLINVLDFVE